MPSSRSLVAELLADLRGAFGALGARWYLFGAQAAIVHGAARLTADVDVTVDLAARSSVELVNALAAAGFEPRVPDLGGVVETTRVLPLVHGPTRIPVDVVLAGPGLEDLFFARVEEHAIGGVPVPVASAEDVLTMKVLAARPKDLDDAEAVIRWSACWGERAARGRSAGAREPLDCRDARAPRRIAWTVDGFFEPPGPPSPGWRSRAGRAR